MNSYIEKLKKIPFSGGDVMNIVDGESKIIRYPDLHKFNNIDEILSPFNCFFLLYETKKKYGHWVCVILHPDGVLEFFDPYGYKIDEQLDFIDKKFRKQSKQDIPYLSLLFLNSGYKLIYNNKRLQKQYKNNSSCGRHIGLRVVLKDLPLKQYQELLKDENNMNADDKVTYLTAFN